MLNMSNNKECSQGKGGGGEGRGGIVGWVDGLGWMRGWWWMDLGLDGGGGRVAEGKTTERELEGQLREDRS